MKPFYAHPLDPPAAYERARQLGERMGEGEVGWEETQRDIHILALSFIPPLDPIGLDRAGIESAVDAEIERARNLAVTLCWHARDHAYSHGRALARAQEAVSRAVRPLMGSGTTAAIEEAAGQANSAAGSVLDWDRHIFPILRAEVARLKAKRR